MTKRLDGKVVVVTGSTKGIGRGIAEIVASEGATAVVTGRTAAKGEAVVSTIRESGNNAVFVAADLTSEDDVRNLAAEVRVKFGRLDGLVNNAAAVDQIGNWEAPITELSLENWNRFIQANLTSLFLASKYCMQVMLEAGNGGSVVNISSVTGIRGMTGSTGYAASKGAIVALTKSVASFYGRYDVRCNTLTLGSFPPQEDLTPERRKAWESFSFDKFQLGLEGEPADVAWAAVYLLSDEARFITAANLSVDGGWSELSHAANPRNGRDLPQYERKRPRAPEC